MDLIKSTKKQAEKNINKSDLTTKEKRRRVNLVNKEENIKKKLLQKNPAPYIDFKPITSKRIESLIEVKLPNEAKLTAKCKKKSDKEIKQLKTKLTNNLNNKIDKIKTEANKDLNISVKGAKKEYKIIKNQIINNCIKEKSIKINYDELLKDN
jgi:hypothetical protein